MKELPPEFGLVIDVGDLSDGSVLRGKGGVELLGDGSGGFGEFVEEGGGDSEEVDACEGFDFAGLQIKVLALDLGSKICEEDSRFGTKHPSQ